MTNEKQVWMARRNTQAAWEKTQSVNSTMADVRNWMVAKDAEAMVRARCAA